MFMHTYICINEFYATDTACCNVYTIFRKLFMLICTKVESFLTFYGCLMSWTHLNLTPIHIHISTYLSTHFTHTESRAHMCNCTAPYKGCIPHAIICMLLAKTGWYTHMHRYTALCVCVSTNKYENYFHRVKILFYLHIFATRFLGSAISKKINLTGVCLCWPQYYTLKVIIL